MSIFLLSSALALSVIGAIAPPPLLPHRPVSFAQNFRLLLERNIFDMNRRPFIPGSTTTTTITAQPQSALTLTGLVYEDGAYSAFVEDSRTNITTKYRIGDAIAGGKITAAGMDYLNLAKGGRVIHVYLGQTLAGTAPMASTNPTTEPSPGNDIIERLRQRRLQELHQ